MPRRPLWSGDVRVLALVVALCIVGDARSALAQERALIGVVRDSARGLGVAGVEVRIEGSGFRAQTDEHGAFRFTEGTATAMTLSVRRLGFAPRSIVLTAEASASPIDVVLAPSTQPLAPVTVRARQARYSGRLAGYYERLERRTIGQFITRADLEREHPPLITDMIQRAPGVHLQRGRPGMLRVRLRGRECSPLIWVDGAALTLGDVDLDAFSPASLEGIELYLGASSAPQRYQGSNGRNECGTILLWSRGPDTEPPPAARSVAPPELEALIASSDVFAAERVDQPVVLDSASLPVIEYPPSLRAAGTSGVIVAEFVVDTTGHAEPEYFDAVSATDALLTAAVREALPRLRFRPAMLRGRLVRQVVRLPFEFTVPPRDGSRD